MIAFNLEIRAIITCLPVKHSSDDAHREVVDDDRVYNNVRRGGPETTAPDSP